MKKIIAMLLIVFLVLGLSSCKAEEPRIVNEIEVTYDYIGVKSIEVNGELFTTVCKQNKDDGLWNTPGAARLYTDSKGDTYTAYACSPCSVIFNNTLYHGFDLLEDKILTVEELELLEFPFSEYIN